MKKILLLITILAISALAVVWTKTGENAKESALSSMDYNYSYDKKDVYVDDATADLAILDQKINEISEKLATASEAAKTNAQIKIQHLREQRIFLNRKLDALKKATAADWNDAKYDYIKSYIDVKATFKEAWQQLTEN